MTQDRTQQIYQSTKTENKGEPSSWRRHGSAHIGFGKSLGGQEQLRHDEGPDDDPADGDRRPDDALPFRLGCFARELRLAQNGTILCSGSCSHPHKIGGWNWLDFAQRGLGMNSKPSKAVSVDDTAWSSGPWGRGIKSRAPDQNRIQIEAFVYSV